MTTLTSNEYRTTPPLERGKVVNGYTKSNGAEYRYVNGAFSPLQVVPPGTEGSIAVVYPNPDFYDRSIPPWEAQSICVSFTVTWELPFRHFLYPTLANAETSLDWDALAKLLK